MFSRDSEKRTCLAVFSLLTIYVQCVTSKGCTGNQPLVSGFHFSVLDYQMWSNSNDTTSYPGSAFGEDSHTEMLISYEGRIGADHYRGWCSEFNPTEQPFLQIDFKREVIIQQVETQGLQLDFPEDAARYIKSFWLEYSTNTTTSFINVTQLNSNVTKMFSGQDDNDHTASRVQDLPQPITARIVRIYPTESVPDTRFCLKLELHGCVPQREEECQSVYPLSCCSYGQPGDIISSVEVTSDDPDDSVPGPVSNILSYYNDTKFWCGDRDILPANATFNFSEEVLLTSVAFHGLDGPLGDDYVTQYSWEYSVGNSSTVKTYTDLGNNTIFENTREDKFQQTFWTPIHVQTLNFVAHARAIRPCMAFQFFGCKLNEVISISQMPATVTMPPSPTITSDVSTTQQLSSESTIVSTCSTVTVTSIVTPTATMTSTVAVTSTSTSTPMESPTPSPKGSVTNCIGDEEPLISGMHYYVNGDQLSASGHDPLHYTYDDMNERVSLLPEEGRIGNDYGSFLGWCSEKVTNVMKNAPFIQVDFDTPVMVSTVAVQGFDINSDKRQPRYVLEFQLAYKDLVSEKFCTVNDENGLPMNFTGNNDKNYLEIMKSSLNKHIRAKVFRLYPRSWISKAVMNDKIVNISRACLKWELYGCAELKTEVNNSCFPNQNLLDPSNIVNVTSNSHDTVATTSLLRLIDSRDNWCPSAEDIDLPLVIDFYFAEVTLLTSLAIAGRKNNNGDYFVSSYSLSYASNASCNLTLYEDLSGQSVFYNNHVRTVFHSFWEPIYVRQLQLLILDWHITPCVSIGFFGCRSSDVNFNFTANSSEIADGLPQGVCNVPVNNILLSCVNEQRDDFMASCNDNSDDSVITIVAIVLAFLLASLLLIIIIVLLYRRFKTKLRSGKLRYAVRNPLLLQSENPLYETSKTKTDGNYEVYFNRDQATVKLLNDDQSRHYSKLQHHRRDGGAFSSNPYDVLQPQQAERYAQEGPKESAGSITYEEIPYHEITSKSDENQ